MPYQASVKSSERATAVILAAGPATRMGWPKQLLNFGNGTLLTHAIDEIRQAGFERIIVVLGAQAHLIGPALAGTGVEIAMNPEWETGMGSSIRSGLRQAETGSEISGVLGLFLADQPHITAAHLIRMREALDESSASAIAAEYAGGLGVPVLFRKELFPLFAALPAESGAKQLLRSGRIDVARFPLPEAAVDIDTPADFAALETVRS